MDENEPWVFLPKKQPVPESPPETAREIIRWWERRRLRYSLIVLLVAAAVELMQAALYPTLLQRTGKMAEWNLVLLFAVFTPVYYLVVANIAFTFGWIAEIAARAGFKDRVRRFGPIAYTAGVVATIVLILGPALYGVFLILSGAHIPPHR